MQRVVILVRPGSAGHEPQQCRAITPMGRAGQGGRLPVLAFFCRFPSAKAGLVRSRDAPRPTSCFDRLLYRFRFARSLSHLLATLPHSLLVPLLFLVVGPKTRHVPTTTTNRVPTTKPTRPPARPTHPPTHRSCCTELPAQRSSLRTVHICLEATLGGQGLFVASAAVRTCRICLTAHANTR